MLKALLLLRMFEQIDTPLSLIKVTTALYRSRESDGSRNFQSINETTKSILDMPPKQEVVLTYEPSSNNIPYVLLSEKIKSIAICVSNLKLLSSPERLGRLKLRLLGNTSPQ